MKSTNADPVKGLHDRTKVSSDGFEENRPVSGQPIGDYHPALTVAVIGFEDPDALRDVLPDDEFAFLCGRLGTACAVAASEFGGKLVQQTGQSRVLVFGSPLPQELDAERAVLAAQKVLRMFARGGYGFPVNLRCGIASGPGHVVYEDSPNLSPHALAGKTLDVATRLEREGPGNDLIVAAETYALFRSDFLARKVVLSDDAEPAYQVSPAVSPAARADSDTVENQSPPAFTGRRTELQTLERCWQTAKTGCLQSVMLVGEPGIGKSSLIGAFLDKAAGDHPLVLRFHGSMHHRRTPYYPVAQGLYAFLGLKGFQSPTLLSNVIGQLLVDLGLDTHRNRVNLDAILKGSGLDSHPPLQSGTVDNPGATVIDCIGKLSAIHPVMLIYEDMHWMDISTLTTIDLLHEKLDRNRILAVISRRPGKTAADLSTPAKLTCRIGQLAPEQTRRLAAQLRPESMSDRHFEAIIKRSDGIPLFLEELMNNAADTWTADSDEMSASPVPASLRETLAARLSHLGDARDLLFLASVVGREFGTGLLQEVSGLASRDIETQLTVLQRANLVFQKGAFENGLFEFKHSLVQDLAYQSVAPRLRSRYHRVIAAALTEQADKFPAVAPEVIARHHERCGDAPAALKFLEIAGLDAVRVAAHRDAGRYFKKALKIAQRLDDPGDRDEAISRFSLLLGPQLIANHGFASDEVQNVYSKARSLSAIETGSPEVLQMLWGLWGTQVVKAELAFAKRLSDDFLRHAMVREDPIEVTAGHYMAGVGAFYVGALEDAEQAMLRAVEASHRADFDEMVTRYSLDLGILSRSYLSWCYALMNRPEELRDNCLSLETAALLSDHAFCRSFATCFMATAYNFFGDTGEAERHARTAAKLSSEEGFAQQKAQADINLGRARAANGDETGIGLMKAGLSSYLGTGAILARPYAEAWIAEACLEQGAHGEALDRLLAVRRFTLRSGERYFDAELMRLTADAIRTTRPASRPLAETLTGRAETFARHTGNKLHLTRF